MSTALYIMVPLYMDLLVEICLWPSSSSEEMNCRHEGVKCPCVYHMDV